MNARNVHTKRGKWGMKDECDWWKSDGCYVSFARGARSKVNYRSPCGMESIFSIMHTQMSHALACVVYLCISARTFSNARIPGCTDVEAAVMSSVIKLLFSLQRCSQGQTSVRGNDRLSFYIEISCTFQQTTSALSLLLQICKATGLCINLMPEPICPI